MLIQFAVAVAATGFFACASSSPLAQISPQVEVDVDADAHNMPRLRLSIETWQNVNVLADAIANDQIVVTLDDEPLAIDPVGTTSLDQGDAFIATFALPSTAHRSVAATTSALAISDGTTTWNVAIKNLFAIDLAPTTPLAPGENTLEWPSAIPRGELSTIYWACVEIVGASSACGGYQVHDPSVRISQQYINAKIDGKVGDRAVITAERHVAPTSTGPIFVTKILNRYEATLASR